MMMALRAAGLVTATLVVAGCGSTSSSTSATPSASAEVESPSATPAPGGPPVRLSLAMMNISFQPTSFTVPPGAAVTITVQNRDTSPAIKHNFTATGGAKADQDVDPGTTQSVSFTAPASGTIPFHCEYHPAKMTGTITIAAAPAAAPAATPAPAAAAVATTPPVVTTAPPALRHPAVPTRPPTYSPYGY